MAGERQSGHRSDELKDKAIGKRKWVDPVLQYKKCTYRSGMFWMVFNFQEDYHYVSECFYHK